MDKRKYGRKQAPIVGGGINDLRWSGKHYKHSNYEVKVYNLWYGILKRCYSERELDKSPTYKDCTVCDEWKTLSNFERDIRSLPNFDKWCSSEPREYELDKDILGNGKKIYSPQTCCFVTKKENEQERNSRLGNPGYKLCLPVVCTFKDGTEKQYESIAETSIDGFSPPNVCMCLKGKHQKTHLGCTFRYA